MTEATQPAESSELVRVASVEDLADGEARRIDVAGERIALVRVGEQFCAIGDRCSHANFSLSEGEIDPDEMTIECWKHGAQFSLCTGEPETLPATKPVPVYEVGVSDGEVFVRLRTTDGEEQS